MGSHRMTVNELALFLYAVTDLVLSLMLLVFLLNSYTNEFVLIEFVVAVFISFNTA
jgi:hypothetical protein